MTRSISPHTGRIILAVALKDITEAFKNRNLLIIVLSVLLLMSTGPVLSLLVNREQPTLVMLAPHGLGSFQSLKDSGDLRIVQVESQQEFETYLLQPPQTIIGVIVPESSSSDSSSVYILDGYTAHWVREERMLEHVAFFEASLSQASGTPIRINMDGHRLYPSLAESPQFTLIAMSLMTIILLMGFVLVPYLFIEEKECHTLEALLVSPARFWHIVLGKLIAGAVYCLAAAVIVLLFNLRIVVHWDLMLLTVLLGAAFSVAVGLLLGILFDNTASMGLWTGILTILLLIPPLLTVIGANKLSAALLSLLSWLPPSALNNLIVLSLLGEVPLEPIWQGVLLLLGSTLVLCLLVIWRIRRMDR